MDGNENLHAELQRLRAEVNTLTQAVAYLIQRSVGHQAMLDTDTAFLAGLDYYCSLYGAPSQRNPFADDVAGSFSDWPGRPRPDLVPELTYNPPTRQPEDTLPRTGRNPRIGCEQYPSGTWIHGRPHDCPRTARR